MSTKITKLPERASRRILSDLRELEKSNLEENGIYFHLNEDDMTHLYIIITGAEGTPYADCPFLFELEYSDMYPMTNPKGKFCTGDGKTRFNPNLYVDGKICLSILGTWEGPSWTPVMTTLTIIMSIQGLVMIEEPIKCEPGWEKAQKNDVDEYNAVIEYRSLQVALVNQLKNTPQNFIPMRDKMVDRFRRDYMKILGRVRKLKAKWDGKEVKPRYGAHWKLDYTTLEKDLIEFGKEIGCYQEISDEIPEVIPQISEKRPKPGECEIGDEWGDFVVGLNVRGVKYWKKK